MANDTKPAPQAEPEGVQRGACLNCGKAHWDEGEWATRPHRTHRCVDDRAGKGCGHEWRGPEGVAGERWCPECGQIDDVEPDEDLCGECMGGLIPEHIVDALTAPYRERAERAEAVVALIRHERARECTQVSALMRERDEVMAAAGKSIRWGLDSSNPELPPEQRETNGAWLHREMGDLSAAIDRVRWLCMFGDDARAAELRAKGAR